MSASDFEITINEYLSSNYALNNVIFFRDGYLTSTIDFGPTFVDMQTDSAVEKPDHEAFTSFRIVHGVVINAVIGYKDVIKRESVSLEFSIFRPKSDSRKDTNEIEDELDRLFLNSRFDGSGFQILPDTANPKSTVDIPARGDDISSIKQIQYRFLYMFG
eukprot:GHVR01162725.1.p1 GENE.GHVR01162725.1~~GHVR01162725.1.p1  ORF type:complete len:175 (-),score=7.86 GHVR01162725.1:80-559(-)